MDIRILSILALLSATMAARSALIIGLNPAFQKSIAFSNLQTGAVNRGTSATDGIGGKGQNVAVAAGYMSVKDLQLAMFLGAGSAGDLVGTLLHEKTGIPVLSSPLAVRTNGKCRTCISLMDASKGETTEIIEPSEPISSAEIDLLLSNLRAFYATESASGVAVMGSMPPGCPSSLYGDIIASSCDASSRVVFDTVSGLSDGLAACARVGCKSIVKVPHPITSPATD